MQRPDLTNPDRPAGTSEETRELLAAAYGELRPLAAGLLAGERTNHTLSPTALVNEAAARVLQRDRHGWRDRSHVIGYAAMAMRHLLVDHARARGSQKRAGAVRLDTGIQLADKDQPRALEVLALDEAITRLASLHARQARVVELRFFGGLTVEQVAHVLGVSLPTVESDWRMARTWLHRELSR